MERNVLMMMRLPSFSILLFWNLSIFLPLLLTFPFWLFHSQYQDAYVRGEIKAQRGGNVLGAPPSPPPSASPSYSSIPPSQASASDAPFFSPNPSVCFSPPPSPFVRAPPTAFTDTEGSLPGGPTLGKRKMGQGPEEKRVAPVSSEVR
jgi:hypothetical protein